MNSAAPYLKLVGRVLLSIMFIQSGVGKIFGYAGAQAMMEQHGVSGALLPLVILTEAGGGLLVLLGLFTPYAAIALAGFCLLAAWLRLNAAPSRGTSWRESVASRSRTSALSRCTASPSRMSR